MSDKKVILEIQAYSEGEKHYVRMTLDGHETQKWGPLPSHDDALLYAKWAGKEAEKMAKRGG